MAVNPVANWIAELRLLGRDDVYVESFSGQQAGTGNCSAVTGGNGAIGQSSLTLVSGGNRQQKTPSGGTGRKERVKGVEPSTFTLAT